VGYFDALASGTFKLTEDGRRVFFPWGIMSRGYAIPSESEFERLRRRVKAYHIVSLLLTILAITVVGPFSAIALAPVLILWYAVWARSEYRRLAQTREQMTVSESMAGQVRAVSTPTLWLLEINALLFVGIGVFILFVDPGKWPLAIASIVFFGLCAAMGARMIVMKTRGQR